MSWNIAKPGDQINGPVAVTGNLNVDSNTLFVDSANNRVGVLTASPTVPLDVVGDAKVSGNLTVDTNTLVVDAANNRLGIGTATPATALHVFGTGSQALSVERDGATIQSRLEIISGNSTNLIRATVAKDLLVEQGTGTEVLRIATNGVCTWSNVGGVAGTAMTLNGTGLGIGIGPTHPLTVNGTVRMAGGNGTKLTWASDASSQFIQYSTAIDGLIVDGYDTVQLQTRATPRVTVNSSGNVGIGTATPGNKLDVVGGITLSGASTGRDLTFSNTGTNGTPRLAAQLTYKSSSYSGAVFLASYITGAFDDSNDLRLYTGGGNERLRIDSAGNLGLGVTPKTWGSAYKAIQVNTTGAVTSYSGAVILGNNYYANSSGNPAYITAASAGAYAIVGKAHTWYRSTDATPVADGACTLDPAMTLDASGNLGIGTTTILNRAQIQGAGQATTTVSDSGDGSALFLSDTGAAANNGGLLFLGSASTNGQRPHVGIKSLLNDGTANGTGDMAFLTRTTTGATTLTEKMRLTTAGNLGLGVTPSAWGYSGVYQTLYGSLFGLGNSLYLGNNWRYAAGVSYKLAAGYAHLFEQNRQLGTSTWYTSSAGAGAAGDTITFNPQMTLDASGFLGVGMTPVAPLSVRNSSGGFLFNFDRNSGAKLRLECDTDAAATGALLYVVNSAASAYQPLRIDASVIRLKPNGVEALTVKTNGQTRFVPLASAPASPEAGDVYYDSSTNKLRCYNGTIWNDLF